MSDLNREISGLREPKPEPPDDACIDDLSDGESWVMNWVPGRSAGVSLADFVPRDWTGSEEASAVLLEEMPEPMVWEEFAAENGKPRVWGAEAEQGDEKRQYFPCAFDADRKTAIAKAWLAWKKSIVEAAQ